VLKVRVFVKYWLPVLIWMFVIFSASGDKKSFHRSSRIIGPIVHWLFPQMSETNVNRIVTVARKGAHLTEYAVLAALFWRAVRKPRKQDPRPWSPKLAIASILFVALYAITDELHQSYVPNRQGSAWDVLLDTLGAAGGVLSLWLLFRWRRQRHLIQTPVSRAPNRS
jgi:VanZ family protein